MMRFLKPEVVQDKVGEDLLIIDINKADNNLPAADVEIRISTSTALQEVKAQTWKTIWMDIKAFYVKVAEYFLSRYPLDNKLLKYLACLHLMVQKSVMSDKPIKVVAKKLSTIIPAAELSTLGDEWKLYMSEDKPDTWWWNSYRTDNLSAGWLLLVLAMKNTQGELK